MVQNVTYKFTIIIPVYNAALTLKRCIDSILVQQYPASEVIFIDDGSTDDSVNVILKYTEGDERFIILQQENAGPGVSRNRGIETATGDYIVFCDSDDTIEPELLYECAQRLTECEYDAIYYDYYSTRLSSNRYITIQNPHLKDVDCLFGKDTEKFLGSFGYYSCSATVNRDFIMKNGIRFSKNSVFEDNQFFIGTTTFAKSAAYIHKPLFHYRANDNSIFQSAIREKEMDILNDWKEVHKAITPILSEKDVSDYAKSMVLNHAYEELFRWYVDDPTWYGGGLSAEFREQALDEGIRFFNEIKPDTYEFLREDLRKLFETNSIQNCDYNHIKDSILRSCVLDLRRRLSASQSEKDKKLTSLNSEIDLLNKKILQQEDEINIQNEDILQKEDEIKVQNEYIIQLTNTQKILIENLKKVKAKYYAYKQYPGSLRRHIKLYIKRKLR